jgi:antirestriction protein ArdC
VSPSPVMKRLDEALKNLLDSDNFRKYLQMESILHRYSARNIALIYHQCPHATRVAGYRAWQKLGRHVRRGEKGIMILVPILVRVAVIRDDGSEDVETTVRFRPGYVFDVSQTDGDPLPEVRPALLTSSDHALLYQRLVEAAGKLGVRVSVRSDLFDGSNGFYVPEGRQIFLKENAPDQMAKTLAHELAHHVHLAVLEKASLRIANGVPDAESRSEEESVAEGAAFVVCAHFGLNTEQYSVPYLAIWARDINRFRHALEDIQRVSSYIIDVVEGNSPTSPQCGDQAA